MNQIKPIRILPEFIANQIAAGEVVQRPESVVKELVENAFDASAKTIMVVVKEAGKQMIYVVDDGIGMTRDDLKIALRRHATSKVYDSDDLEAIRTFGFRGEALASIASVANVEIRTIRKNDATGWKLTAEPMREQIIEPCILDSGTQIFVRNLFYNIPVRKKFLRTNLTEFRYIADTMTKMALSKPEIRFIFYDGDTLVFDAKAGSLLERIGQVTGQTNTDDLLKTDYIEQGIRVFGYIGIPAIAKQAKTGQFLFLNGRSIKSKSVSYAVYSAYEHLLEKTMQPFYVLNIELDPHQFDVNVHPQKHEVKFDDEKLIFNIVNSAVINALATGNKVQEVNFDRIKSVSPLERVVVQNETESANNVLLVNKSTGEIVDVKQRKEPNHFTNNYSAGSYQNRSYKNETHEHRVPPPLVFNDDIPGFSDEKPQNEFPGDSQDDNSVLKRIVSGDIDFRFLQVHDKYLIIEIPQGVLLVDQHAAHERVLYERILKSMDKLFPESQRLLFPEIIELSPAEIATIREIDEELRMLGFDFDVTKDNKINVLSVPLFGETPLTIKEIVMQYREEANVRPGSKRDHIAASAACKAAIKTGASMTFAEAKELLKSLAQCDNPRCCPHGRPVSIILPLNKLDILFGRIL